jgi:hypothetical protein
MLELLPRLGSAAHTPQLLTDPAGLGRAATPGDLDSLFDMLCGVQEVVGQSEVELTLLELDGRTPQIPGEATHLGDPQGKLLHAARIGDEYLVVFTPAAFRARELLLGGVARVLGHIALDRAGLGERWGEGELRVAELNEWDADAELAAVLLGMGVWVANGAYLFENACCGGGCGIDLRSLRAGLSLPEACYALALDGQRKGLSRRALAKHLAATQAGALKECWRSVGREQPTAIASAASWKALR